jgi:hypothetical protein
MVLRGEDIAQICSIYIEIKIKTVKLMASVGFAKLLRIRVRIYSVVKAASPPKIKILKF